MNGSPHRDQSAGFAGAPQASRRASGSHGDVPRPDPEEQLRWLKQAVDQSASSILITDYDGRIEYVNRKFTEATGYTPEEAIGCKPSLIKSGLTPRSQYELLWRTIKAGWDYHGEVQNRRKNGDIYWDEVWISPIREADGTITHFLGAQTEITARKRHEESLRARERQLQAIVDAVNDLVFEFDGDGTYLSVWAADEAKLAAPREELLGRTVTDVIGPEHAAAFVERFRRVLATGVPEEFEYTISLADRPHTFRARLKRIDAASGLPATICMGATDVTSEKLADATLQASETRYRLLFESNPHPMWVLDLPSLRFLEVNAAALQHYGYLRQEFLAMTAEDIRPPEDVAALHRAFLDPRASGHHRVQSRHRRRDGSTIYVDVSTHPILYQERRALLVLVQDVTQRHEAEQGRAESERRLHDLAETADLIVIGVNTNGTFNYVNPYTLKVTGYTQEELMGQRPFDVLVPPARREEDGRAFREHMERETHQHFQTVFVTKAGKERVIALTNTIVRDPYGQVTGTLSIGEDITDRLRLEEQLRQSQKMEAIGQLAGGVAHDFNNLLTVIGGYVDLLRDDIGPADPRREDLDEIGDAVRRASDLTRQLLLFGRRQVLQPIVLDLNKVVTNLEKMLRRLIGEDIAFETVLDSALGAIRADAGQVEQILLNLSVNARDAMPQGGRLTIETANVEISEEYARGHPDATAGPCVRLAVRDTGMGMTREVQQRIFEPFFTTKERGKGTGLGLATVYAVVRESGGWIDVQSEPDRGALFTVYLPRVFEAIDGGGAGPAARALNGTEAILLVEDEPAVRAVAYRALARYGYAVTEAPDAAVALELVKQGRPIDLILTDVVMPGMSGRELVERLSPLVPRAKVIYMSGFTDDAVVRHGVLLAGMPFIQKPFRAEVLAEKVRDVLDAKTA